MGRLVASAGDGNHVVRKMPSRQGLSRQGLSSLRSWRDGRGVERGRDVGWGRTVLHECGWDDERVGMVNGWDAVGMVRC